MLTRWLVPFLALGGLPGQVPVAALPPQDLRILNWIVGGLAVLLVWIILLTLRIVKRGGNP